MVLGGRKREGLSSWGVFYEKHIQDNSEKEKMRERYKPERNKPEIEERDL